MYSQVLLVFIIVPVLVAFISSKSKYGQVSFRASSSQIKSSILPSSDHEKIFVIDVDDNDIFGTNKESSQSSFEMEEYVRKKQSRTGPTKPKKETSKKPSIRDMTGYIYQDDYGTYDVPILSEPMWFQVQVVKNKEFMLRDHFLSLKTNKEDTSITNKVKNSIIDAFVPEQFYPKFKGKDLVPAPKPLTAGVLYLKVKMDPDLADYIESVEMVVRLVKKQGMGIVIPLDPKQGQDLESARTSTVKELDRKLRLMKKDGYVSVISGIHKGKYGILNRANSGRFEVLLRSEYKDDPVMLAPEEVEHLENPPEKKWTEMTAKDAIEALIVKDSSNPILKSLRNSGKLQEILYADEEGGGSTASNSYAEKRYKESRQGREGGARVRSIRSNSDEGDTKSHRMTPTSWDFPDGSSAKQGIDSESAVRRPFEEVPKPFGATKVWSKKDSPQRSSSYATNNQQQQTDLTSSGMDDWLNDLLGSTASAMVDSGSSKMEQAVRVSKSQGSGSADEDYESLIQSLLNDLDGNGGVPDAKATTKSASGKSSNSKQSVDDWLTELNEGRGNDVNTKKSSSSASKSRSAAAAASLSASAFSEETPSNNMQNDKRSRDKKDSEKVLEELLRELNIDLSDSNLDDLLSEVASEDSRSSSVTKSVKNTEINTIEQEYKSEHEAKVSAIKSPSSQSTPPVHTVSGKRVWVPKESAAAASSSLNSFDRKQSPPPGSRNANNVAADDNYLEALDFFDSDSFNDINKLSSKQPPSTHLLKEPSMEEYPNFESYIAAVVKYESDLQLSNLKPPPPSASSVIEGKAKPTLSDKRASSLHFTQTDENSGHDTTAASPVISDVNEMLDEFYSTENVVVHAHQPTSSTQSTNNKPKRVKSESIQQKLPSLTVTDATAEGSSSTQDYNSLTVKSLKELLKTRGMAVSGTKAELIARLLVV